MTAKTCEQLDAYLLGDLDSKARAEFERHLSLCDSCRLGAREQTRIDGLIKAATEAIGCPAGLTARISLKRNRRIKRRRAQLVSLIAASLAVGLLGWTLLFPRDAEKPFSEPDLAHEPPIRPLKDPIPDADGNPKEIAGKEPPAVRIEFPDDVLSLPIETGDPDITLIQLFPVSRVANDSP